MRKLQLLASIMPIPLLVDKDGFVLNYDEEDGHLSYIKIFEAAITTNY